MKTTQSDTFGTGKAGAQSCAPGRAMSSLTKAAVLLLSLAVLGVWSGEAMAIAKFARITGNWGTAGTWSSVSCAAAGATVIPTNADDVTICPGVIVTMNSNPGAALSLVINGTANWTAARTTNVGVGGVTINAGGNITGAVAGILTSTGGLIINAALTSTTVTITLQTTAAQTISGTGSLARLTVTGAGVTATNTGTLTVTTALAGTGTLANNTGTLNIGGTSAITTLNAAAAGNTVNYTGAAQTAKVTTYNNLTLSGSLAKTFATTPTVNGVLSMEGTATVTVTTGVVTYGTNATLQYNTATARTATVEEWITPFAGTGGIIIANTGVITMGAAKVLSASIPLTINSGATLATGTFAITVGGNVSNSGTHTATTGSITLNGGAVAHTLSGTGTYANLILNDALGATLTASPTVSGTLTLTTGTITTGTNTLITSASCPASVVRTSGHVIGNLRLAFPTLAGTTTCTYDVGDSIGYAPVTVALTGATAGTLTGRVDSGDHSDTIANLSGIDQTKSANRYWTLTPGTLATYTSYAATLQFCAAACTNAERDATATVGNFIVAKKNAGAWIRPTVTGTPVTTIQATGITSAQGFGEFAVGKRLTGVYKGVNQLIDLREVY